MPEYKESLKGVMTTSGTALFLATENHENTKYKNTEPAFQRKALQRRTKPNKFPRQNSAVPIKTTTHQMRRYMYLSTIPNCNATQTNTASNKYSRRTSSRKRIVMEVLFLHGIIELLACPNKSEQRKTKRTHFLATTPAKSLLISLTSYATIQKHTKGRSNRLTLTSTNTCKQQKCRTLCPSLHKHLPIPCTRACTQNPSSR